MIFKSRGDLVCEDGLLETERGGRAEIPAALGGESMRLKPPWMRLL